MEDPADAGVDMDQVVVLDDWLDGMPGSPRQALAQVRQRMAAMPT